VELLAKGAPRRSYARGETVSWTYEGTDSSLLFLIGAARAYRLSEMGKEVTLRQFGAGDVMAIVSGKSHVEATADETAVGRMPRRRFLQLVQACPGWGCT
jgi:CRP-like cAMP-binding protein